MSFNTILIIMLYQSITDLLLGIIFTSSNVFPLILTSIDKQQMLFTHFRVISMYMNWYK